MAILMTYSYERREKPSKLKRFLTWLTFLSLTSFFFHPDGLLWAILQWLSIQSYRLIQRTAALWSDEESTISLVCAALAWILTLITFISQLYFTFTLSESIPSKCMTPKSTGFNITITRNSKKFKRPKEKKNGSRDTYFTRLLDASTEADTLTKPTEPTPEPVLPPSLELVPPPLAEISTTIDISPPAPPSPHHSPLHQSISTDWTVVDQPIENEETESATSSENDNNLHDAEIETLNENAHIKQNDPIVEDIEESDLAPVSYDKENLIEFLNSPSLTVQSIRANIADGIIDPALVMSISHGEYLQAKVPQLVVRMLFISVMSASEPQADKRLGVSPPPGFSALSPPKDLQRDRSSISDRFQPRMSTIPMHENQYEREMERISNQMTMNVLD